MRNNWMMRGRLAMPLSVLSASVARADVAPDPVHAFGSPLVAVVIFAVVIGIFSGIIIWRRRR